MAVDAKHTRIASRQLQCRGAARRAETDDDDVKPRQAGTAFQK